MNARWRLEWQNGNSTFNLLRALRLVRQCYSICFSVNMLVLMQLLQRIFNNLRCHLVEVRFLVGFKKGSAFFRHLPKNDRYITHTLELLFR